MDLMLKIITQVEGTDIRQNLINVSRLEHTMVAV